MKQVTASANRELDDILDLIGASTQITPTMFDQAETSYHAVGDWLDAPDSPVRRYRPIIFPQGSLALDTTNKPWGQNEFDLDAVCLLQNLDESAPPARVYDFILARVRKHETYARMTEPKERCIRLNYAGDFHLDIVPAVFDSECRPGQTCLYIPDRKLETWRSTNPKGYIGWFNDAAARRLVLEQYSRFSANKKANVTPLSELQPAHLKPPLKLAVQLLKRWRDVAFCHRMHLAPSSIVLTTLAGMFYLGEHHPTDALTTILRGICEWAYREKIRLYNPSNPKECITDRWAENEKMYDAFLIAIFDLHATWQKLLVTDNYADMVQTLKGLFETSRVNQALKALGEERVAARESGSMYIQKSTGRIGTAATPILGAGAIKVKDHRFHGQ